MLPTIQPDLDILLADLGGDEEGVRDLVDEMRDKVERRAAAGLIPDFVRAELHRFLTDWFDIAVDRIMAQQGWYRDDAA